MTWTRWALIVAMVVLPATGNSGGRQNEFDARLETIRAAGLPAGMMEVAAWRQAVPEEWNAASILKEGFAELIPPPRDVRWPIMGGDLAKALPLKPDIQGAISAYLEANRPALDLLHRAGRLPIAQFPADDPQGSGGDLLLRGRLAAQLLCLHALVRAGEGDTESAVASLEAAFLLGRAFQEGTGLARFSIGGSILSLGAATAGEILNFRGGSDEELARLFGQVHRSSDLAILSRALVLDRAFMIDVYKAGEAEEGFVAQWQRIKERMEGTPDGLSQFVGYLDFMDALIQAATIEPLEERLRRLDVLHKDIQRDAARQPLAALVERTVRGIAIRDARVQTEVFLAAVALAVERHRSRHGVLPAGLDDLVPEFLSSLPVDPFNGGRIGYDIVSSGYQLRGSGSDGEISLEILRAVGPKAEGSP